MPKNTPKEIEEGIIRDYSNNIPIKEIVKKYNVCKATVNKIRRRNKLHGRRIIYNDIYQDNISKNVVEDYKNGLSIFDMGAKYGVSTHTIYKVLRQNNIIPNRQPNLTEKQEQELAQMYVDGYPVKEIREKYNISDSKVYYLLDKYNIQRRVNKNKKIIDENIINNIIDDYINSDLTLEEIYTKYNISSSKVLMSLLRKNNIHEKRSSKHYLDDDIINDYNNGILAKDICAKYNIDSSTMYRILKRNNIKPNRK